MANDHPIGKGRETGRIEVFSGCAKSSRCIYAAPVFYGTIFLRRGLQSLFFGPYGNANRAYQMESALVTRFGADSIPRALTATAFLQFISQGNLSLKNRITKIIDLSGTKIPQDVKLKDLLTHTSGHADEADEEPGKDDDCALFVADAMFPSYPQEDLVFSSLQTSTGMSGNCTGRLNRYLSHA